MYAKKGGISGRCEPPTNTTWLAPISKRNTDSAQCRAVFPIPFPSSNI